MTLIITYGNCDHVTQLSDRRLTANGHLLEDESNKAAVLYCNDGRLAISYTGLARINNFETREWLMGAIHECGPPDFTAKNILDRLTKRATNDFKSIPTLANLPTKDKYLGVMFTGYLYRQKLPFGVYAILSNHPSYKENNEDAKNDSFSCFYKTAPCPDDAEIHIVATIGFSRGLTDEQIGQIRSLVVKRVRPKDILNKAIDVMKEVADHPASKGLIGKQLNSITIPKDISIGAETNYHSETVQHKTYLPDLVLVTSDNHMNLANISLKAIEPDTTPPMSFPKVGRNQPCPCKSGKKFKHCHG